MLAPIIDSRSLLLRSVTFLAQVYIPICDVPQEWIIGQSDLGDFVVQSSWTNEIWGISPGNSVFLFDIHGYFRLYTVSILNPWKTLFLRFLGHLLHSIIATITNWYMVLDKYCWIAFQKCYIYTVPSLPNWILFLFNLFFWINWDVNCCTSLYKFKSVQHNVFLF